MSNQFKQNDSDCPYCGAKEADGHDIGNCRNNLKSMFHVILDALEPFAKAATAHYPHDAVSMADYKRAFGVFNMYYKIKKPI